MNKECHDQNRNHFIVVAVDVDMRPRKTYVEVRTLHTHLSVMGRLSVMYVILNKSLAGQRENETHFYNQSNFQFDANRRVSPVFEQREWTEGLLRACSEPPVTLEKGCCPAFSFVREESH